jgi:hypothetical protein
LCFLDEKKFNEARAAVDRLRGASLASQLDASLSLNASVTEFDARPLPSFVSSGSAAFDSLLWAAAANSVDFVLEAALFLQTASADAAVLEGRCPVEPASPLFAVHAALQDGLVQLHQELDASYELPCPEGSGDKGHRVLDPVWLRKASALVRVLVPVAALVLEFLSLPVRNENTGSEVRAFRVTSVADSGAGGKKNSAKKKAAAASSSSSSVGSGAAGEATSAAPADSLEGLVRAASASVIRLFGETFYVVYFNLYYIIFISLRPDMLSCKLHDGETSVSQASVLGFVEAWRQRVAPEAAPGSSEEGSIAVDLLFPDGAIARQRGQVESALRDSGLGAVDEAGMASTLGAALELMRDGKAATAAQVASSQRTSCARLAEVVDHKLKHLKHLFL